MEKLSVSIMVSCKDPCEHVFTKIYHFRSSIHNTLLNLLLLLSTRKKNRHIIGLQVNLCVHLPQLDAEIKSALCDGLDGSS